MLRFVSILLVMLALALPLRGQAQTMSENSGQMALWVQDRRLLQVAERIMSANASLCRSLMPLSGMIYHSADQYPHAPEGWFANGALAIAQVLPDTPAEAMGLRAGDGLLTINGIEISALPRRPGFPLRDEVFELLSSQTGPLHLRIRRADQVLEGVLVPSVGCRALVEVLADNGNTAHSDGRVIQISYGLAARLDEAGLAVTFAHELAHVVLEHRRRLSEAGVAEGLARELGRSRRLSRVAEDEADRLSVHLLANAGYDPVIAPAFWRSGAGGRPDSGILRSRIYPSREERARILETEIARHLAGRPLPSLADHLIARRDSELSG